jgi:hypothetical protein
MGWMGEDRPPVALLRSVVRERVGAEIVPQRRSPPGEFQGIEAPPDVVKYFADDRRLGDREMDPISSAYADTVSMSIDISISPTSTSNRWWKRTGRRRTSLRNGVGYALLTRFYIGEASWWSFTEHEQWILRKVSRVFARDLREAGFLPDPKDGEEVDRGL